MGEGGGANYNLDISITREYYINLDGGAVRVSDSREEQDDASLSALWMGSIIFAGTGEMASAWRHEPSSARDGQIR